MNEKKQTVSGNIHESLCVALILALLGGFLDAYTFILKNGVFANAQTGNLILLSVSLFNGEYDRVPQYLLPIVFFSLGILLSEYIKETPLIGQNTKKIKIVIDGNSQNIEQGTDKKGKFYKVYYNEEK